jgi:hypothetical protein
MDEQKKINLVVLETTLSGDYGKNRRRPAGTGYNFASTHSLKY